MELAEKRTEPMDFYSCSQRLMGEMHVAAVLMMLVATWSSTGDRKGTSRCCRMNGIQALLSAISVENPLGKA